MKFFKVLDKNNEVIGINTGNNILEGLKNFVETAMNTTKEEIIFITVDSLNIEIKEISEQEHIMLSALIHLESIR